MSNLPLPLLIELAQQRADEAAKRLGLLQQAQLSAAAKLDLLLNYRSDYLLQLQQHTQQGLPLPQLRNYQDFVQTLDSAIEQQGAVAQHTQKRLEKGRIDWQGEQRQVNAFDTLALRARQEAVRSAGRYDQKISDERAARLTAPAMGASMGAAAGPAA